MLPGTNLFKGKLKSAMPNVDREKVNVPTLMNVI